MVATYYAISNFVGIPELMTYSDLQTVQSTGNEIASHSMNHPDFTKLNNASLNQEIYGSKQTLESYGLIVNNFAYPWRRYK